jgi:AcrR family transcriptional regulator
MYHHKKSGLTVNCAPMGSPPKAGKPAKPQRRTQAERRAATRGALLDATIDCLIEFGYADTTTSRIVERAGVSRGAQVHHFPTKAELVAEAVRHLAERRAKEFQDEAAELPEGPDRVRSALDLLWKIHSGPLFQAALELWVAARTDPELRKALADVEREIQRGLFEMAAGLFGSELAARPEFEDNVNTALSTMQGTAVVTELLETRRGADAVWAARRDRLAALFT